VPVNVETNSRESLIGLSLLVLDLPAFVAWGARSPNLKATSTTPKK
jgi:hypothetical protein